MASSSSIPSQSPTPPSSPSPSQSPTPPSSPSHSGEKFLVIGIGFDCDAVELRTLSKLGFKIASGNPSCT
ncbi:hypothetical protein TSUD_361640 [Trifolium subterraneum]|uniref:Uncharacterized protein n=1 Tax=Trifolium subterraneum TaxID=3900 RepID=A0A2Z6M350_TRISU|nr:hypothetical protein TSUD_361640 [Trifolium subterraneum]